MNSSPRKTKERKPAQKKKKPSNPVHQKMERWVAEMDTVLSPFWSHRMFR